ncbi:MAG: VWA domain-containing protein, partial [Acidobacteriales bacterium]|nr:VWA domain-containing protein [Terriglobales bacterium]
EPQSNTGMAGAFLTIKAASIQHAILITDGLPDDERTALLAARGLKLDIFYVGPPPQPDFLRKLAAATGGSFASTTLKEQERPQLQARIRGLLTS